MNIDKILIVIVVSLVILAGSSCKKDKNTPLDMGYDYFPTEVGKWIIYDVDSIVHNDFSDTIDTYTYQVKEIIESEFYDNEGRTAQRIERYKRANPTEAWAIKDVWFSNRTASTAEKVEENVRFIKLAFPVQEGKKWNGNALNTLEKWEYRYDNTDISYTLNNLVFDSTATVIQINDSNAIEKKYSVEVYAKNLGMIYKELIDVADRDTFVNTSIPLMERINTGVQFKMKAISYGGS